MTYRHQRREPPPTINLIEVEPNLVTTDVDLTWLPCPKCGSLRAWWHRDVQRCMDCDGFTSCDREGLAAALSKIDLTPPKVKVGRK